MALISRRIKAWTVTRVFTDKVDDVDKRIDGARRHVDIIQKIGRHAGAMLVVPTDKACPEMGPKLQEAFAGNSFVRTLLAKGNPNSDVLNAALHELHAARVSFATIISGKTIDEHFTSKVVDDVLRSLQKGYYAVGVRTEQSRTLAQLGASELDNTFCTWDIDEVLGVGGFTSNATEEVTVAVSMLINVGTDIPIIGMVDGPEDAKPQHFDDTGALEHYQNVVAKKIENQERAAASMEVLLDYLVINTHRLSFPCT